jgi:hypothetical protein
MSRITVNPGKPDGPWTRTLEASGLRRLRWRDVAILAIPVVIGLALALWALGTI